MSSRLVIDGVSVGHGGDPVVHDATLTVPDGAVLALVGPNGSGKSTLLKSLYRVLKPLRGHLLLGDDDLAAMPHRDNARAVGVLAQDDPGGFDFTVWEAVMLGRSPHLGTFGRPGPGDAAVVADALERTGCTAFSARPLSELSGGERQRVLLARALAQCSTSPPTTSTPVTSSESYDWPGTSGSPSSPRCTPSTSPPSTPTWSPCCPRAASPHWAHRPRY